MLDMNKKLFVFVLIEICLSILGYFLGFKCLENFKVDIEINNLLN